MEVRSQEGGPWDTHSPPAALPGAGTGPKVSHDLSPGGWFLGAPSRPCLQQVVGAAFMEGLGVPGGCCLS